MKGYYRKLFFFWAAVVISAGIFWLVESGRLSNADALQSQDIALSGQAENQTTREEVKEKSEKALIVYSDKDADSVMYKNNCERVLYHLRMEYESVDAADIRAVDYRAYDLVVGAHGDFESGLGMDASRLLEYIRDGGSFFMVAIPVDVEEKFSAVYRQFGIASYGDYADCVGFEFTDDLFPGSSGEKFYDKPFEDVALEVALDKDSRVYARAKSKDGNKIPMIWTTNYGSGRIAVMNGTAGKEEYWVGVVAGCITSLYDTYMYPVINVKTIFVDDFPAPQYDNDSNVIRDDYNRTVKEFYRDIWWPDMQSAANRYDYKYTGMFVATYNDIVDPDDFVYKKLQIEQYYGNSLLRNNYEIGAHGYNHQSLALAGQVPDALGYNAWNSIADMEASMHMLVDITKELFPQVTFKSYVPPSNYLSAEGRQAVVSALPDLEVISGIYSAEDADGGKAVCLQDFRIEEDGIADFPRLTSGMPNTTFTRFSIISGGGLYGVFSHFIHPDDILDDKRSAGMNWEEMSKNYHELLAYVNDRFAGLRPATATESGAALNIKENVRAAINYGAEGVSGALSGFYGNASFYLRTEKEPEEINDSCRISKVSKSGSGYYYLVEVQEAKFSFRLK